MSRINYDLSLIRAFACDVDGVLSPSVIPMHISGEPLRMVNIKDGYAIQLAVKLGFKFAIISGGRSEGVRTRFAGLGVPDIFLGVKHKVPVLQEWMQRHSLSPEQVAYLGDDIPDIEAMQCVGLPVAPADAATEAKDLLVARASNESDVASSNAPVQFNFQHALAMVKFTLKSELGDGNNAITISTTSIPPKNTIFHL